MKKNTFWFTLVEMLTVIALIAIIALWTTRISFKNITDNQKSGIFAQRIISKMQAIKNYATTGFWVGANLYSPNAWRVEINVSSWSLHTQYLDSGSNWQEYALNQYSFAAWENITKISCVNYFTSASQTLTGWYIQFYSTWITLPSCSAGYNLLKIETRFWGLSKIVQVNTLNSVIESL